VTEFFKLSGAGNDFVALVEPEAEPSPERIRAWCRRGVSLGADGLISLRRDDRGEGARPGVTMTYYNSDGLPADLCLNGTRCAARLAFHLGWADRIVRVDTGSVPVVARQADAARITLELPAPAESPRELPLEVDGIRYAGLHVRVGVPHYVLPWPESLDRAPVESLGARLRRHPALGSDGANVNFVRFPSEHRLEIRTFERGVEAETLACGSGILASAAAGLHLGRSKLPLQVVTQGGFELEVGAEPDGATWTLAGDARLVARGDLLDEAAAVPAAPQWS
jgi:diaminopimelate epimerase